MSNKVKIMFPELLWHPWATLERRQFKPKMANLKLWTGILASLEMRWNSPYKSRNGWRHAPEIFVHFFSLTSRFFSNFSQATQPTPKTQQQRLTGSRQTLRPLQDLQGGDLWGLCIEILRLGVWNCHCSERPLVLYSSRTFKFQCVRFVCPIKLTTLLWKTSDCLSGLLFLSWNPAPCFVRPWHQAKSAAISLLPCSFAFNCTNGGGK